MLCWSAVVAIVAPGSVRPVVIRADPGRPSQLRLSLSLRTGYSVEVAECRRPSCHMARNSLGSMLLSVSFCPVLSPARRSLLDIQLGVDEIPSPKRCVGLHGEVGGYVGCDA